MAITIGSNITSLQAQRQLRRATSTLSEVSARLSSGQRINRASDDAAGLAISSSLKTDSRIYSQAIRNVNDGISALNIAEGALSQLSTITIRQIELAEQAANGTLSLKQRRALYEEANALAREYNRIVQTTTFNGRALLDVSQNSQEQLRVQCGYGIDGNIAFSLGSDLARTVGTGEFGSETVISATKGGGGTEVGDIDGDGHLDIITSPYPSVGYVFLGHGDGTFDPSLSFQAGETSPGWYSEMGIKDFNGDGEFDLAIGNDDDSTISVLLGNGDGTFKAQVSYSVGIAALNVAASDFNNDGVFDLCSASELEGGVIVMLGNGDGSFNSPISLDGSGYGANRTVTTSDFDQDGNTDIFIGTALGGTSGFILFGNGDGSFKAKTKIDSISKSFYSAKAIDLNADGIVDLVGVHYTEPDEASSLQVHFGNGDGTFKAAISYDAGIGSYPLAVGDLNNDGLPDAVTAAFDTNVRAFINQGNNKFSSYLSTDVTTSSFGITTGDLNEDGVLDIIHGRYTSTYINLALTTKSSYMPTLNLFTQESAKDALPLLRAQLDRISSETGSLGAVQSRLDAAISTLQASRLNYDAAASRITDADIALESSSLMRLKILQQAAASVLAQANQQPALALKLLT